MVRRVTPNTIASYPRKDTSQFTSIFLDASTCEILQGFKMIEPSSDTLSVRAPDVLMKLQLKANLEFVSEDPF